MKPDATGWSARVPLVVGFASVLLLVGTLGAWSVGTRIAGAVVASGTVRVASERQVVQHPDGGVVSAILARDGDRVEAGDVLLRFDGTFLRSELAVVEQQLAEIFARRARLVAERDDVDAPDFSDPPGVFAIDPTVLDEDIQGQRNLFEARRETLEREREQLAEQRSQIENQIEGYDAQLRSLGRQSDLLAQELRDMRQLYEKDLVPTSRVLKLEREKARLEGETGRLIATIAEARTRISALETESLKLSDQRREEAITRLRDLRSSEMKLTERQISLRERLARLEVRAPVSGTVFSSRVAAVQSVVRAAEPMMYIVPGDQPLQITARIDPIDVDQVYPGQDVSLMFATFDRRTTPRVPGRVVRLSADAEKEEATGASFYEAIIEPDEDAIARLDYLVLRPGIPAEVFLKTNERTPLAYLLQPLSVYFNRAFRDG